MKSDQDRDEEAQVFTIKGRQVTISPADVLAATYRQQPAGEDVRGATHWAVLRRSRVPTKWALRMTLAYLEREQRGNAEALPGTLLQTNQADAVMRRLGFHTGIDRPHLS